MLKNIFSPVFYHQNAGKCRKMYSKPCGSFQLSAMFSAFSLEFSCQLPYFLRVQLQVALHVLSGTILVAHLHQQIAALQEVLAQRGFYRRVFRRILLFCQFFLLLYNLLRQRSKQQNRVYLIQIHNLIIITRWPR